MSANVLMNFDPQKFFIGLIDFVSILRPDALLTILLVGLVDPTVLGDRYAKLDGTQAWAAFLFASYLFDQLTPGNLNLRSVAYGPMIL